MRKLQILGIACLAALSVGRIRAQGTTGVNNAELQGDYAFTFNGMTTGGGGGSTPFAAVGRFTADGAGNLTKGVLDTNGVGVPEKLINQAFTGTYSVSADNRGVMNLNIPGGGKLAFVMISNGSAKFVEIDAAGGNGTVGSGSMEKADTTAYSTGRIVGDYAFGVAGFDLSNNRSAIAGRMTANGAGTFTSGVADANQSGMFTTLNLFASSYLITDTTSGRGMLNLPPLAGGIPQNLNFVFYVVNSGKIFAMESDAPSPATPLLNGVFLQQQTPLGGFSNASLNGGMVMTLTGRVSSGCGRNSGAAPNVLAGLLTGNATGALTLTYDQNCGGAATSVTALAGTSTVASNGRTAIYLGSSYMVAYLLSSNQAFFIVPDSSVLFGFGDPQAAAPLTNTGLSGAYAGFATEPVTLGVTIFSGEFAANGASPTGTITGTEDVGAPGGANLGVGVSSSYSITSAPTNGRGTFTGNVGGSSAIVYVVSPAKFVVVSASDLNPAVLVFEQ
jgi:hypothetical protein